MDEELVGLRDVSCVDCDAGGNLYGVKTLDDGEVGIAVYDARQEVLDAQQRQTAADQPGSTSLRITTAAATQVVHLQGQPDFDIQGLCVNRSGRYVALHGYSQQDSSVLCIAIVDVHGAQPIQTVPGAATRHKRCPLHKLDAALFGSRPGLVALQLAWHPHSEDHLVLLASDSRLRLYNIPHSLAVAEQTFHVAARAAGAPARFGLSAAAGAGALSIVAFAFGPPSGWGMLTMLLLAADGLVYSLGPVAPFGMRVSSAMLQQLAALGHAQDWLQAAFGEAALREPAAKARWPVLPHVVDGVSPAVVGPLNSGPDAPSAAAGTGASSQQQQQTPAVSLQASHSAALSPLSLGQQHHGSGAAQAPEFATTAVVTLADGRLLAYTLGGALGPAWCDSAPMVASTADANATPVRLAGNGAAPSLAGPLRAVRYDCLLQPGGAGSGASPQLLLLDVVELPQGPGELTALDGAGPGGSGGVAWESRPMVHLQGGGPSGSALWWCRRRSGAWSVRLPWMALLPQWLAAGVPGAGMQQMELPAPAVAAVLAPSPGGSMPPAQQLGALGAPVPSADIVDSCLLQDPLAGGGLLVLDAAGALYFLQPPGAASALLARGQAAASEAANAGADAGTPGAGAGAGSGTPSSLPTPEVRRKQVESHIEAVYGHLLKGPKDLPIPSAGPEPVTASSPDGLRVMAAAVAALRSKYVEYVHSAAHDLQQRCAALQAEAAKHAAAAAELAVAAEAAEARQAALVSRLATTAALQANLLERVGLLASLHWSLPRCLSSAELALRQELEGLAARVDGTRVGWVALRARSERLMDATRVRHVGGGAGGGGGGQLRCAPVPEAQLEKVHDAVVAQYRGLSLARSAADALQAQLAAAKEARAKEALEGGAAAAVSVR